jgi:hypothetical protein
MARGRLVPEALLRAEQLDTGAVALGLHAQVVALGQQHARQNSRALTVEDLRKGCVARITNQFQSVKDLDNSQFDRLLLLFSLLIEAGNLKALSEWQNYERYDQARAAGLTGCEDPGKRKRYIASIKAMTYGREAYLYAILKHRFHTVDWQDLPLGELRQLLFTIKTRTGQRTPKKRRVVEQPF